jgi:hypothetical protein
VDARGPFIDAVDLDEVPLSSEKCLAGLRETNLPPSIRVRLARLEGQRRLNEALATEVQQAIEKESVTN